MKITKRQLRRIIRESQWQNNYDSWIAQRDRERSDQPADPRKMRDMGYNDAMSGKYKNKKYMNQIDYASGYQQGLDDIDDDWNKTDSGPDREWFRETDDKAKRVGGGQSWSDEESGDDKLEETVLKVTRRQLERIIKEEAGKAGVFGSGMEAAELEPDQKEIVGHT